jgi:hypothetical protein
MSDLGLDIDTDDLTDAEQEALAKMTADGHVYLEASESYTLWNALRDHPEVTMAELEPDLRALFSTSALHAV